MSGNELSDLALEGIRTLGGRAPAQRIAEYVADHMSEDAYRNTTWNGFVSQVRNALRVIGTNGLPSAVSVSGEYVEVPLLSVDEYRTVVGGYAKRASANLTLAQRFADECHAVHGERIDVAALDGTKP